MKDCVYAADGPSANFQHVSITDRASKRLYLVLCSIAELFT